MKSNAKPNPEFENFENAMRRAFQISKTELQRRLDAEKLARADKPRRGPKPKTSASDPAASDKG
jgi:hypothetical protein